MISPWAGIGDRNRDPYHQFNSVYISGLYGEQFIVLQYIPHVAELIALCKRTRVSANLEGGLVASMALLKHTIPYLAVTTLTEIMQVSNT
jgi:hypothetical protein